MFAYPKSITKNHYRRNNLNRRLRVHPFTSKAVYAVLAALTGGRAVEKSRRKTWGTAPESNFCRWQIGQGRVSPGLGFGGVKRFGSRKGLKTRRCRGKVWFGVTLL